MTIFVGADHRGFDLKNSLIEYLHEKNIRIEDLGNYQLEPEDDYPNYAKKVAQAVLQKPNEFLGIVICGSGVGVCIAVNRFKGIRCGLGFEADQVKHIRENDHVNILALAADYLKPTSAEASAGRSENNGPGLEKAKELVDIFISAKPKDQTKYLRRIKKLDEMV